MKVLEYKGYKGSIEYDEDYKVYHGEILEVGDDLMMYEGKTLEELEEMFHGGVDDYIQMCEDLNESSRVL